MRSRYVESMLPRTGSSSAQENGMRTAVTPLLSISAASVSVRSALRTPSSRSESTLKPRSSTVRPAESIMRLSRVVTQSSPSVGAPRRAGGTFVVSGASGMYAQPSPAAGSSVRAIQSAGPRPRQGGRRGGRIPTTRRLRRERLMGQRWWHGGRTARGRILAAMTSTADRDALDRYCRDNQPRFVDELVQALRIPSISADPAYAGDVVRNAEHFRDAALAAGFTRAELV